jgi:uncharacterized OB-fold protein
VNRDDDFYWEGLALRELRVRVCDACGRGACPPLPGCPHCGHEHGHVVTCAGDGSLYTWTVCHVAFDSAFADDVPYVVGAVDLPEGARVMARVEGVAIDKLRDSLPVRVQWTGADTGRTRLVFVPAEEGARGGS